MSARCAFLHSGLGRRPSEQCASYGLDLPLSGSVDAKGRLVLDATDDIDTLSLSAILDSTHSALAGGSYKAIGLEAYPQTSPAQGPCATPSGRLDGVHMPSVTASYVGTLRTTKGADVVVRLMTHQDTIPLAGMWNGPKPALITHGNMVFLFGGFAVTGTMQLTNSVCGITTGTIQPQNGYVWGTVLQIEFDTDSTYHTGATFDTYIDPATGVLSVVSGGLYDIELTKPCSADFVPGGTLTREG